MFISPAFAQDPTGGGSMGLMTQMIPILLLFVIFYFIVFRPQQQRVKQHRDMVANVRRGDIVVTGGGIIGKVTKVIDDHEVQVEIGDNMRVRIVKSMISEVRNKGEPVKD